MPTAIYIVSTAAVFVGSGVLAMAGLGAAFLFVPLFYYLGISLPEATSAALLLNVVSLVLAAANYARGRLINWRVGVPVLVLAVALAPLGALMTAQVPKKLLLSLFVGFLLFAGAMMLFYRAKPRQEGLPRSMELGAGAGIGALAGFLGGLLGVGGGNFILPVLNWLGLEPKKAAGTTALVVVFSSFSGFLGHVSVGGLNPLFITVTAIAAAGGSAVGSHLMRTRLSSRHLKLLIGILLWAIAAKMIYDLIK